LGEWWSYFIEEATVNPVIALKIVLILLRVVAVLGALVFLGGFALMVASHRDKRREESGEVVPRSLSRLFR